jgi:hypothetical protein
MERAGHHWKHLEFVLGSPSIDGQSGFSNFQDELCIAIVKQGFQTGTFEFRYSLSAKDRASHASAVLGYQGKGSDSLMTAFLLMRAGAAASATIWRADGSSWQMDPDFLVPDLPLTGTMKAVCKDGSASLLVDGSPIFSIPLSAIGGQSEAMGMRWLGASVLPISTGFADRER